MISSASLTVIGRFREIVARHPDRLALRQGEAVTYRELDALSNEIAARVSSIPIGAAPVVGLSLAQMRDVVAAMLGVLKTGRAYSYIHPGSTLKRKLAVAGELGLELVLADALTPAPWPGFAGSWINLDDAPPPPLNQTGAVPILPTDACCIIQTSGTTGQPLGVEISHASLLHTIDNYSQLAAITPDDRLSMLTSPAHFAAHTALFGALLNGACLCPFEVRSDGFPALANWLEREKITIYQSPPSLFRAFFRQLPLSRKFPALRLLRLGGETAVPADFEHFQARFGPDVQFVNALGISEAGGNVAYLRLERAHSFLGPVLPVGLPSAGQQIQLVDESGREVKRGEVGELVVTGDFLATGYYRQSQLTAARFRSANAGGARELWTGDLGHISPEGWLVHDGRKDDQIKIRGHRVDLFGLESILRSLRPVHDAVVLPRRHAGRADEVIAFVVPATVDVSAAALARELVDHTASPVTPRLLLLPELPLTAGGKIDRSRLLEIAAASDTRSTTAAPRDEAEKTIATVWKAALGVGEVGVYDNFFAAGGDSLKALDLCAALEQRFRISLSPAVLIDRPTIAQMAEYIARRTARSRWRGWFRKRPAECILPLSSSLAGRDLPLFVCPGGWGHESELLVFAAMLPHLPPELPVYGLKQIFLSHAINVSRSVERMAANFILAMKQKQPVGPYRLLGECAAGVIVLEMVHQLRRQGEAVEKIILLDPRLPKAQLAQTSSSLKSLPAKVRQYYRILAGAPLRALPGKVSVIGTEDFPSLLRRVEPWNVFDAGQIDFVRVPGNHETYIRAHGPEVARAITAVFKPASPAGLPAETPLVALAPTLP